MLTDTRFWLGAIAGGLAVYFVLPYVKGAMAQRSQLGQRRP